jgi:flagellin-like protein
MIQKRGLSPVIASMLMILITVAGVSLIATFIIPFVGNSLEGAQCVEYRNYFLFEDDFGYNCHDVSSNHGLAIVKKPSDSDASKIDGFEILLKRPDSTIKVSVRGGDPDVCTAPGTSILGDCAGGGGFMGIPGDGLYSAATYVYHSDQGVFDRAEVYPVLKDGEICDMSDSIKLNVCDPGVDLTQ